MGVRASIYRVLAGTKQVLVRILLPPAPPPPLEWVGGYPSWATAEADSRGYDDPEIEQATLEATRAVVSGEAVYERDGVTFPRVEYSWPLTASLLYVATRCGSLRVVDVGGSLGSSYRQNLTYTAGLHGLEWRIVDRAKIVAAGQEFAHEQLRFFENFDDAAGSGADAVLFGASLCYFGDYGEWLSRAARCGAPYMIVDRTGFIDGPDHEVTLQRVRLYEHETCYPCWRFSKDRFESELGRDWGIVESWECELQPDPGSVHRGYLLERVSA